MAIATDDSKESAELSTQTPVETVKFVPSKGFKTFVVVLGILTGLLVTWGMYVSATKSDQSCDRIPHGAIACEP